MRNGLVAVGLGLLVATGCDAVDSDAGADTNPPTTMCYPVYPVTTDAITVDWSNVTEDFWGQPVNPKDLTEITLSNLLIPPEDAATRLCGDDLPFYGNDDLESVAIVYDHVGTGIVLDGPTHTLTAARGPVEGKTLIMYLVTDPIQRDTIPYRELILALAPLPGGSTTVTLE